MKNSCSPGKAKTYITIGQDLFSIEEYVTSQYNFSLHHYDGRGEVKSMSSFAPAAAMFYTDLETLRGLWNPADYGSGIQYAGGISNSLFPDVNIGIQIGMWLNGTYGCDQINNGEMNKQLHQLSKFLEANHFSAVFLRLGYEFDNPFFGYSDDPRSYADAFRYIVRYLRGSLSQRSMMKTKFVWHSWAAPKDRSVTLEDFYPGDEFVDWVGISVFQQLFPWSSNWQNGYVNWGGDDSDIKDVLGFAKAHKKPTMIAESTPFGGINLNNNNTRIFNNTDPWDRWFGRVIDLIETYDIDMWSYINCDWDNQPMWHNVGFGDTRLSSNSHVMKQWQKYIIQNQGNQTFLHGDSLQCEELEHHIPSPNDLLTSRNFHRDYTVKDMVNLSTIVLIIFLVVFLIRKICVSCCQEWKEDKIIPSTNSERQPINGDGVLL